MRRALILLALALFTAGCNLRPLQETPQPTLPPVITATPLPRSTVAPPPTVVPATVPAATAPVAVAPPSDTPVPPSATPSHTPTDAFCEYEVRAQDTLMAIIRVCGYGYQQEIAQEVVRINDNVFDEDILPEGEVIRIPPPDPNAAPRKRASHGRAAGDARIRQRNRTAKRCQRRLPHRLRQRHHGLHRRAVQHDA